MPGLDQLLERVEDHRLAPDGQEVLVGHLGQREQPRAGAAGEHDPTQLWCAHRCAPAAMRTEYCRS